jgi:hypothetical protein
MTTPDHDPPAPHRDQDDATEPAGAPELRYPDAETWVHLMFLPTFGWRVDDHTWRWCSQWWRHTEAVWRLELLWRSWEAHRLQPTGMSAWSVELDRHLRELLGPDGTFRQCRSADGDRDAHHTDQPIPAADLAPDGWWNSGTDPAGRH